ncbi:MAG: 4-hydroxy-tetrahydrodipicolinate synthase [Acidobacteriota bacterium]|jgi:4-hydroxy-tetrahydrodipicolinate synthase|nr:4-hydroxy-tetrahydrodipicolinate synthase [Acidobacteriota bacterium]
MENKKFHGCGTALVTPFQTNGAVDAKTLAALVDWQIEEGVHFLVPCGTTGESPTLNHDEYLLVVETVTRTANGRVPILAGAGGNDTAKVIALAAELKKLGVDGLLSVSPSYNKPSQEGICRHYRAVAESTDLPIIVYNVPGRTGANVVPDTLMRLGEIPNIAGVKEASGDIAQIGEICARAPEKFAVLSGDDLLTLPVIALGGCGVISVAANEVPGMMAKFITACLENRRDEAREWNRKLYPLMKVNFVEANPVPVKAALAMMGKINETCRLPLAPIADGGREKVAAALGALGLI